MTWGNLKQWADQNGITDGYKVLNYYGDDAIDVTTGDDPTLGYYISIEFVEAQ